MRTNDDLYGEESDDEISLEKYSESIEKFLNYSLEGHPRSKKRFQTTLSIISLIFTFLGISLVCWGWSIPWVLSVFFGGILLSSFIAFVMVEYIFEVKKTHILIDVLTENIQNEYQFNQILQQVKDEVRVYQKMYGIPPSEAEDKLPNNKKDIMSPEELEDLYNT